MGYTHYYPRVKEFDIDKFSLVVKDCRAIIKEVEVRGIRIAGSHGDGEPTITDDLIAFNGLEECGHTEKDLGITWPSDDAYGIGTQEEQVAGEWFAGLQLRHRSCGGDCSHESFVLPRVVESHWSGPDEKGLYFYFCKTAYKPYDLAVIMCLLIAKHHLGDDIQLCSDGTEAQWADGVYLVRQMFGYEELAPR